MSYIQVMNIYPIIISALVGMALGAVWYSPLLFGDIWLQASGKTREQLGAPAPAMIGSIISCLVAATAVEFLVVSSEAYSLFDGMVTGLVLGVAIVGMSMLSDSLFSGWDWSLYFIQAGYRAAYLVLMGALCGAWPRA